MARKPLGKKPISPIVPIALKLKELGYDPIWLYAGKGKPPAAWNKIPNTIGDITAWRGRTVAVRMSGTVDLFAIDLDVQRQDVLDAIIARYQERWPEFMSRCVIRHSDRVSVMLIGRLTTPRRYMHSGRYGVTEEEKGGNRVELFTSNDSRYIAVWGMHSEGRNYGYDGPELHETAREDLPEFLDTDLNELLDIANKVMEGLGLAQNDPPGEDKGEALYDLTPDQMAELQDGRTMTLAELEDECGREFVYVHGKIFSPGSEHFRVKAKVTSMGLTLWDWGNNGVPHYWKHLGPQPEVLASLLKKLVEVEAVRTAPAEDEDEGAGDEGGGGGGGTTVFAPAGAILPGAITQDDVAQVFAERLAGDLQYCHDTGKWYYWTGVYWMPERTRLAFQCCRELGREISEMSRGRAEFKEVRKVSFAGGVEKFAQADRRFATTAERWNRDVMLLGTPEGTLDLRTGALRAPDPVDGITRLTAVAPVRGQLTPRWDRFLKETFQNDVGLIRFAQVWFGYCLTGDISEHALWFGFGEGGNGKGVLLNTIVGILNDYAVTAAMDTFTAAKGDRHSTELAMLQGARLVTASETEKGRAWAEARIKQITGGDPITARFMRQDNFTFLPQFKLALIGNHKPVLRGVDDAVRRRFNLVPFLNKPAVVDRKLEAKLKAEWPGILAWMVEGCLIWQAEGLVKPESVRRATESYFEDQDIVGQWLADCCEVRFGSTITEPTASLFVSWNDYATRAGEYVGNRKAFATELARRGFELCKVGAGNVRSVRGIKLKTSALAKAVLSVVPSDLDKPPEEKK